MVQWFKNLFSRRQKEVQVSLPLLAFNKAELYQVLNRQWEVLFELKNEASWKLLIAQIERIKNVYILDMNVLNKRQDLATEYARHQGRIEALVALENTVEAELNKIKQRHESKGKERHGEKDLREPRRHKYATTGPSLTL